MPREKRLVVVGTPHHITQRGNNRQAVFRSDTDRHFYLKTLKAKCEQHNLRVLGYCLMTNHVHLVATPEHESSMARALGQTHMIYAQRFNFTARRSGHLWQNRFYSCPLGPTRLLDALVYVDTNPVRARIVDHAVRYRWSSAAAHISHIDPREVVDMWTWADLDHERDWKERLDAADPTPRAFRRLRHAIRSGTPYGDHAFVSSLEQRFGRRLVPSRPGPKRAQASVAATL